MSDDFQIRHGRAYLWGATEQRMQSVDDVFRGFVRAPDGSVELEVELVYNTAGELEIDVSPAPQHRQCCIDPNTDCCVGG